MEQEIAAQVVGLGGSSDFSLWKLFIRADFVVKFVIILLIASSIFSWALIFDKFKLFKSINASTEDFEKKFWKAKSAENFNSNQLRFAQKHLRILSGLYGILRPMDVIKPYRLEMGTKLQTPKGKNLYEFWGSSIQDNVLDDLKSQKSDLLINLASKEYFSVLGKMPDYVNVISPVFKDYKNGKHKIISFYAKRARGLMAKWIIQQKIKDFEKLSDFNSDGYYYSEKESTLTEPVFLRD